MLPFHQQAKPYIVPFCEKEVAILYQDEHLLLVNKPEFLLSVPGKLPQNKDCVISRLQQNFPSASVVHRLDLDTSGIMVFPLSKEVHAHISRQFQQRKVYKTYTAIVFGLLAEDSGKIDLPIACDWQNRPLQKICYDKGREAITNFEVIERLIEDNCTRVILKPETGRSHQLRIHLSEMGHPIIGCDLYAHEQALAGAERLMLHATELSFEHPATGELISERCSPEF